MNDVTCYFEMNEPEAELKHMQDELDYMLYSISTGKPFPIEQNKDLAKTQEINDCCERINNHLCDAIGNIGELIKIFKAENEDPAGESKDYAEMIQELSDNPQHFFHEVDCAESVDVLANGKILEVSDIKFDGGDAVLIKVKTVDGQIVEMINTDNGLLCSGWKEV